ncbi:MAG TPA: glycosyltransferase family 4 protein [Bacteroidia bacterium]|nr:glycosyltransferase family 4 protein [Bacteroidia bacterium]
MKILVSAQMKKGTFEAKFLPLSKVDIIEKIYILRREKGPTINKVDYIILPRICRISLFSLFIVPIYLLLYSIKIKPSYLISYHIVPHAFFVYLVSKVVKVPFIVSQTGGKIQHQISNIFMRYWVLKILKKAKYINVPGYQSKDFWIKQGINRDKINVLHSTIDTDEFSPEDCIIKYDFIFVGNLTQRKQIDKIINAFYYVQKKVNETTLAIVGDGKQFKGLNDLVKKLELKKNVFFLGFQKDVIKYLMMSKIFVMASKIEGLPVALMEAMAVEKLVIAPLVDNIPSVLNEETGIPYRSDRIDELSDKMLNALSNFDNLSELRKNARKIIIKEYSNQSAILKWKEILNEKDN